MFEIHFNMYRYIYIYIYIWESVRNYFAENICEDTRNWENIFGWNCDQYRGMDYCKGGVITSQQGYGPGGFEYKFPEENCCGCGKNTGCK